MPRQPRSARETFDFETSSFPTPVRRSLTRPARRISTPIFLQDLVLATVEGLETSLTLQDSLQRIDAEADGRRVRQPPGEGSARTSGSHPRVRFLMTGALRCPTHRKGLSRSD